MVPVEITGPGALFDGLLGGRPQQTSTSSSSEPAIPHQFAGEAKFLSLRCWLPVWRIRFVFADNRPSAAFIVVSVNGFSQ